MEALLKSMAIVCRILCIALVVIGVGFIILDNNYPRGIFQITVGILLFYMIKQIYDWGLED